MARGLRAEAGACHCTSCLRWCGGPYIGVGVDALDFIAGEAAIVTSSDWAERGFCSACGSSLFFRMTLPGPYQGNTFVTLGALDDTAGITLTSEMFVDEKPEAYALVGDHERITGAQAKALLAAGTE